MVSEILDWAGEDADEAQTENLNSTYPSDFRRRMGAEQVLLVERLKDAKSQDKAPWIRDQ